MQHQGKRTDGGQRDRGKISQRVVGNALEVGIDRQRPGASQHDRVTVGGRLGSEFGADDAAGASAIVHNHRLPERLGYALREDAREEIGAAARRKWNNESDRPRWITLGRGRSDKSKYQKPTRKSPRPLSRGRGIG
jgi:hypothetical protein